MTRTFRGLGLSAVGFGLVLVAGVTAWAADPKPATKSGSAETPTLRLIDGDHKPVSGAHVGTFAYSSGNHRRPADESGLMYFDHCLSDKDGLAKLPPSEIPNHSGRVQIVARHVGRGLIALADVNPVHQEPVHQKPIVELTLVPECRISGKIVCLDLAKIGHQTGNTQVYLGRDGVQVMLCASENGEFHFVVPPGRYDLDGSGIYLAAQKNAVTAPVGKREIELTLTFAASHLGWMLGRPAPELRDIAAWKNGPPVKLADLKGKCVLLEFWGYWCPPCVSRMPQTFKLFDEEGKHGLVVIGVHVDFRGTEVDSVAKLDAKLVEVRKKLWHGRDLPFPVAIARHFDEWGAAVADDYAIRVYPTMLLIDRRGNVVDIVPSGPAGVAMLHKALGDKPAGQASTGRKRMRAP